VDITASDISSPSVPQFIDITGASENVITMRDGGRQYKVTVDAQGNVSVTRPGGTVGVDGNGSLSTSINKLQQKRNDQIMTCGTVSIGGQPYYVLGQGGVTGSYLFFAQDQMQRDQAAHAAHPDSAQPDEVPSLSGDVVKALMNGSTAAITGNPDLGVLPDGSKWHLEFDMTQRMWKVKKGAGDSKDDGAGGSKKPKKPKPGGGTTDPPSGSTGTTAGGDQPDPSTGSTDGAQTLEEAVAMAKTNNTWSETTGNNGFDAATRAQVRIMMSKAADGTKQYKVLFDPKFGVTPGNAYAVAWQDASIRTLGMRGVGKYIMLSYAVNDQKSYYYYDLANFVKYVKADKDHMSEPSGSYTNVGDAGINKAKDIVIVDDVLTKIMGVNPDPMIATIGKRLQGHLKAGQQYTISGTKDRLVLVIGEASWVIWPDDKEAGDKGTNAGMTGLRGPGTAMSLIGGATDQFREDIDMGSGRTAHRVQLTADKTAALYTGTEDENVDGKMTQPKVTYVMLDYKKNGLDSRSKPLPVFGGKDRFELPVGVHLESLANVEFEDAAQLVMLRGSSQEKGAIVAVKHTLPSDGLKDSKGNCGGTLLWWGAGLTKEKVQAACEGDGKLP
jgi:hypothetical protein